MFGGDAGLTWSEVKCRMLGGDVVLRVRWSRVVLVFGNDVVSHVPPSSDGEA